MLVGLDISILNIIRMWVYLNKTYKGG